MRTIFKLGTILMLYCLVAGSLLAFVHIKTAPIIRANKEAASGDAVRIQVLPGMVGGFVQQGKESEFTYWIGYRDTGKKQPGGYIFIAYGKGYQSTIETMVGVDMNYTITGIKVLFQQETPGMGDKIEETRPGEEDPWFIHQFIGKSASDNIALTGDDGVIDAITGATVSSRAVTNSISNGLKNLIAAIAGEEIVIEEEQAIPDEEGEAPLIIPPDEIIAEVLSGMSGGFEIIGEETEFPYWIGYTDSGKANRGGYAFIARGKGFASTIQTAVSVNTDGEIAGIKILFHGETPIYGDKIEEIREGENVPWFTQQFIGKSASKKIALTDEGGDIDAISGATISSKAVTESIINGLNNLKDALAGKTFPKREKPEDDLMEQLMNQAEEEEVDDLMEQLMRQAEDEDR